MRRTALCAALSLSMMVGVTAALPSVASAATPCTWTASDLPLPAGVSIAPANVTAPNGYIGGTARRGSTSEAIVWHNRVPTELPLPPGVTSLQVQGINAHGDVTGYASSGSTSAFVYFGGVYQALPAPAGYSTIPTGMNDRGDVVGYATTSSTPVLDLIFWPADAPGTYRIIGHDRPMGIDNDRHVVTLGGLVWSPDGTTRKLPGADLVIQQFHGGRIVGRERSDEVLIQWTVAGTEINRTDAANAVGINANGLLAAWYFKNNEHNTLAAWRDGVSLGDLGDQLRVYAVTDDDQLVGIHPPVTVTPWVPATFTCS